MLSDSPGPSAHERIDVLGVGISNTSPPLALRTIESWIDEGRCSYVCLTPVSGVMAAQRDPKVMRSLNGAGLTAPDGMPMVWAARYAGAVGIERVYGPDLMATVCAEAVGKRWRSFIYGGGPGVAERLSRRLLSRFPGLEIVGLDTPPFRPLTSQEEDEIAEKINASGAEVVWVGLSTPRQDLWMSQIIERLHGPVVLLGVGAAFDIHAGLIRQPPAWLGPLGLFWLYRLLQEPRRLWRRYLVDIPQFLLAIVRRPPFLRRERRPHR